MAKDVIMPVLGMNQDTALLVSWLAKEGDTVSEGDPIMEVETDKAVMQLDAPASGVLVDVTAEEGDDVTVGSVIARIVAEGEAPPPRAASEAATSRDDASAKDEASSAAPDRRETPDPTSASDASTTQVESATAPTTIDREGPRTPASPLARRTADERGVDLDSLPGSGPYGAVLMRDVPDAGYAGAPADTPAPATAAAPALQAVAYGEVERRVDAAKLLRLLDASGDVPVAAALARFLAAVVARRAMDDRSDGVRLLVRGPDGEVHIDDAERCSMVEYAARLSAGEPDAADEATSPLRPADAVLVHAGGERFDAVRPASDAPVALGLARPEDATTLVLTLRYRGDRVDDGRAMTMLADLARLVDDPTVLAVAF